ncbi:MAG: single-stranded DNA-binding protein [Clostridia bacterium]|nr:single-stranded DNA-binding protein [Clostridia bacterium]
MNKVILMGRLVRDPEVRYSQGANPIAIAKYTLAVDRRFKRDGEPTADFIPCVAFGKNGEFVEKWFKKGQLVSVVGRIQIRSWEDKNGNKRYTTEVITKEHYFAESKHKAAQNTVNENTQNKNSRDKSAPEDEEFYTIDESAEDEDLPF